MPKQSFDHAQSDKVSVNELFNIYQDDRNIISFELVEKFVIICNSSPQGRTILQKVKSKNIIS